MDHDPYPDSGHEHFLKIYWVLSFFSSSDLGFESKKFFFAIFCQYFPPWIRIRRISDPESPKLAGPTDPDPKHWRGGGVDVSRKYSPGNDNKTDQWSLKLSLLCLKWGVDFLFILVNAFSQVRILRALAKISLIRFLTTTYI